jgi:hypothetical protein
MNLATRIEALERARNMARSQEVTICIDGIGREIAARQMIRRPGETEGAFKERVRKVREAPVWISIDSERNF